MQWVLPLGGAGDDVEGMVVPDGRGGVFLSGSFHAALDLGGGPLVSQGGADMFLARFDASGAHLWSRAFGDAESQPTLLLAAAPDGGVVIAGDFRGTVDFGGGPQVANFVDAVVARYDEQGNYLWSQVYTGPNYQVVRSVAVDPVSGDVYIGGLFHEVLDIGGSVYTTPGESDGFVAKLDAAGQHVWSRRLGGPTPDYVNAIVVHAGRVAFAGTADGGIDLGLGVLSGGEDGLADAWVALFDGAGTPVWTRIFSDPGDENIARLAFDAQGNVVIGGRVFGSLTLDPLTVSASPWGVYVAKLSPSGVPFAARAFDDFTYMSSIAAGSGGEVVFSGFFEGTIDLGTEVVTAVGDFDGIAVKLDGDLEPQWNVRIGSAAEDGMGCVTMDTDGTVLAFGAHSGPVEIPGCASYWGVGGRDLLLMRIAP